MPNFTLRCGGTLLTMLAQGNMSSNAHISFGNNMVKYLQIMEMLLETDKINIEKKDMFGKTFHDYLEENNISLEIIKSLSLID